MRSPRQRAAESMICLADFPTFDRGVHLIAFRAQLLRVFIDASANPVFPAVPGQGGTSMGKTALSLSLRCVGCSPLKNSGRLVDFCDAEEDQRRIRSGLPSRSMRS